MNEDCCRSHPPFHRDKLLDHYLVIAHHIAQGFHEEVRKYGTCILSAQPMDSQRPRLVSTRPNANWDTLYYAVDASGTILGSLYVDKISITSSDAKGKRGSSIDTLGSISFSSVDLFQ